MKKLVHKHFQYPSELCIYVNTFKISKHDILSISDSGKFSEGVNLFYYITIKNES